MTDKEINNLAEMFDCIINSTNPAVQRSLQHTMLLATLAEEKDQSVPGPFAKMFVTLGYLEQEVQQLRRSVQILENNSTERSYTLDLGDSNSYNNMSVNITPLTTGQLSGITLTAVDFGDVYNSTNIKF